MSGTGDIQGTANLFGQNFQLPPDSVRVYARWWQLETWLREMVYVELKSARGPAWTDTLKTIEDRIGKDKDLIHMATPQNSPLAYHTLGELWKIMKHDDNWPLFATYFPPKHMLDRRAGIGGAERAELWQRKEEQR